MRNKILYVYTENLHFFYRLNKELVRLNIKFEVLNIRSKLPSIPSVILTTLEEIHNFEKTYEKLIILPYSNEDNFSHYILKAIAAMKIEFKEYYSELTFSIDPGTNQIGIVVFLDDYYLQSQTIYETEAFIGTINDYIICFQKDCKNHLDLNFKFGRGVINISIDLMSRVCNSFKKRKFMKIYLIDESKSSKFKLQNKNWRIKTKHEASALIIAMRKGFEVKSINNFQINKHHKFNDLNDVKKEEINRKQNKEKKKYVRDIIDRLLKNELSLSASSLKLEEFKR